MDARASIHGPPAAAATLRLILALTAAVPGTVGAQGVIIGRVVEDAGDRPVAGATVELKTATGEVLRRTVSGEAGAFLLLVAREGRYRLRAARIGLVDGLSAPIEVYPGDTLRVILRMDIQAVQLPALEVVTHSRMARMGRLAEFQYRAARGFGTFLTREDIERRNPVQLTHMLSEHGWDVQPMGPVGYRFAVGVQNRRYGCAPTVYVDGFRVTHRSDKGSQEAMLEAGDAIGLVHPIDVAGIEIYRGPASIPGEFGGSDAQCGVIVIWTGR